MFRAWRLSHQFYVIQLVYDRKVYTVSEPISRLRIHEVLDSYNAAAAKVMNQRGSKNTWRYTSRQPTPSQA
jgi:hypothetical protein